jgi:general stress protein CsbA
MASIIPESSQYNIFDFITHLEPNQKIKDNINKSFRSMVLTACLLISSHYKYKKKSFTLAEIDVFLLTKEIYCGEKKTNKKHILDIFHWNLEETSLNFKPSNEEIINIFKERLTKDESKQYHFFI